MYVQSDDSENIPERNPENEICAYSTVQLPTDRKLTLAKFYGTDI